MKRHPHASANFPPETVLRIRREYAAGLLRPRDWADVWGVSPETIRKIARGDTYRHVGANVEMETIPHPSAPALPGEPSKEEAEASLRRFLTQMKDAKEEDKP